jgi:Family of unknown function (DUF6375)
MKIWCQFGSEHSANLVLIIEALSSQVIEEVKNGTLALGTPPERFGKEMLDLLGRLDVTMIGLGDLEQFAYEYTVTVKGKQVVLTTEEYDIASFLKVMIAQGARIEVYSAHNYPDTDHGRGK